MEPSGVFLLGLGATGALTYAFIQNAALWSMMDTPNERSLHVIPTPRGGGLVFVTVWALIVTTLYFLYFSENQKQLIYFFLPSSLGVALLGAADDRFQLSAGFRLLIQTALAAGFVFSMSLNSSMYFSVFLGFVLFTLGIVWSLNSFNFMDGTDGLAASQAIFVLLYEVFFMEPIGRLESFSHIALVGVLFGFLRWNTPPARIFMGDVGSAFLGFYLGCLIFQRLYQGDVFVCGLLGCYSLFMVDTTLTLLRRILRGESWYKAHRSHAYQRLVHIANWSHKKLLLAFVLANTCLFLGSAFFVDWMRQPWLGLGFSFGFALLVYFLIERIAPMNAVSRNS